MKKLTDIWTLETTQQDIANDDLSIIISNAMKFSGVSERTYLRKLWDNERWQSIKKKLQTEGSVWYVWYIDGVNAHLNNLRKNVDCENHILKSKCEMCNKLLTCNDYCG